MACGRRHHGIGHYVGYLPIPDGPTRIRYPGVRGCVGRQMLVGRLKRRDFLTLLSGAAAIWPFAARAQQSDKMRHIFVLQALPENDAEGQSEVDVLRQGLQALGWIQGRNLQIDFRWPGGDVDLARKYAKEAVAAKPDVLVSRSTPSTQALLAETRTIPIVFVQVADPIASGFVETFARPGGKITGFTNSEPSMSGKWVELLKGIAPATARAAFIFNPATAPYYSSFVEPAATAAKGLGIDLTMTRVQSGAEIEAALKAQASQTGGGIVAIPDTYLVEHRGLIIELAAALRLPAIYGSRVFTPSGGLMSYAVDTSDIFRRAASYVDRILKGDKPADLPVQQPVKYELSINLKTAKALGLDVPSKLLALADTVIE
jgi:putative ABC transport system substrate-binding protein